MATDSLPWLLLAGAMSIALAVWFESAMLQPFATEFMALPGWRNSSLSYANDGMRMVGDFVKNLLLIITFGISFGVLLDARRRA